MCSSPTGPSRSRTPVPTCRARAHGSAPALPLDLRQDAVAGTEFPVIEPDAQAVHPQPLCDSANDRLVLRAVTQKNIVCEIVSHTSPLAPLFFSYQGAKRHGCQPNVVS